MANKYRGSMTDRQLIRLRESAGMSQKELAELINTPLQTYKSWEQKKRSIPGIVRVAVMAVLFGKRKKKALP